MKFKNPLHKEHISFGKILLVLWMAFSILFVGNFIKDYFTKIVFDAGVTQGGQIVVSQIMQEVQKCQPLPLSLGNQVVEIQKTNCPATK